MKGILFPPQLDISSEKYVIKNVERAFQNLKDNFFVRFDGSFIKANISSKDKIVVTSIVSRLKISNVPCVVENLLDYQALEHTC